MSNIFWVDVLGLKKLLCESNGSEPVRVSRTLEKFWTSDIVLTEEYYNMNRIIWVVVLW